MLNINFVPDDYVKTNESRRTNLMYFILLAIVMLALFGSFIMIKISQRAIFVKEAIVNNKMSQAKEAIEQLEERETKLKLMIKTADTTSQLLEPVPRSVLLALLTNEAPKGVSLLKLEFEQKENSDKRTLAPKSKYQAAKAKSNNDVEEVKVSPEQLLETRIDIEGIAPSDLQVADYIKNLSDSQLLSNVALVESKENKIDNIAFRQFKLKAMLSKEIYLTDKDIEQIRNEYNKAAFTF